MSEGAGEIDGDGVAELGDDAAVGDGAGEGDTTVAGRMAGSLTRPEPTAMAPASKATRSAAAASRASVRSP